MSKSEQNDWNPCKYSGNWLTRNPGCTETWFLLKVFLVKSMKIVHSIYSWFIEIVLVKQYFLLSDFVLTSFHCNIKLHPSKSGSQSLHSILKINVLLPL